MASTGAQRGFLPSGGAIFCTIPDILYLPELACGGAVWSLVAATYVVPINPQAYVMAVSVFCFVVTFFWMMVFACGSHRNKMSWARADAAYHGFAAMLYLSSSVLLAWITILFSGSSGVFWIYQLDIAAVVLSFFTTLLYTAHTVFSAIRWKSF